MVNVNAKLIYSTKLEETENPERNGHHTDTVMCRSRSFRMSEKSMQTSNKKHFLKM